MCSNTFVWPVGAHHYDTQLKRQRIVDDFTGHRSSEFQSGPVADCRGDLKLRVRKIYSRVPRVATRVSLSGRQRSTRPGYLSHPSVHPLGMWVTYAAHR
jgi:hypothetical protein